MQCLYCEEWLVVEQSVVDRKTGKQMEVDDFSMGLCKDCSGDPSTFFPEGQLTRSTQ